MDTTSNDKISLDSPGKMVPGPVLRRFVASLLDGIIVTVATFPVTFIVTLLLIMVTGEGSIIVNLFSWIMNAVVIYFYYGYFYSTRGATPGKMVLDLRVIDSESGKNLTYMQAFLREFIGKFISAIPIGAGFFIAIFREDKKGFHDMIFNTQVLHQPKD